MENAADALKMAGAVLIFVLAISIAILSFGQVRQTADIILDYKDRETVYIDGDFYYKPTADEEKTLARQVGLETVIPTIARAYLENYKVVFLDGNGNSMNIFDLKKNEEVVHINSIDADSTKNGTPVDENSKAEFLCGILYHKFEKSKTDFENKFNITLGESLYSQLSSARTITEYLGVYYQNDNADVPEINKVEKRIITYKVEK